MSHIAKSRILEEIIKELRKQGQSIPENVMRELKSARTMMEIDSVAKPGKGEVETQIDTYLKTTEAYLITEADKHLAPEKVQAWLQQLDLSACDNCVTVVKAEPESKFISGVPRDQKWIRVQPIESMPLQKLKVMATETQLGFREENDSHLIVYGTPENIQAFVKKMTQQAAK
jgi:hypothetical protein